MPHVTDKNKVISDITEWKEQLVMPDLQANCSGSCSLGAFIKKLMKSAQSGDLLLWPSCHRCIRKTSFSYGLRGYADELSSGTGRYDGSL
ncbi:MAG: hypothetical protein ACLTQN_01785 [Blautia massiliensis (ex Durand et al. 2017)]